MKKLLAFLASVCLAFSLVAADVAVTVTGETQTLSSLLGDTVLATEDSLAISLGDGVTDATLTLDGSVVVSKLSVTSTAGTMLTLESSSTPAGAFDFSGAEGELHVDFDTGANAVTSGADTYFSYAGAGKLTVPANSRATLTADDVWKDAFTTSAHDSLSMTDTSRIRIMPASGSTGTNTGTPFGTMNKKVKGVFELAGLNSAMTTFQVDRLNHFEISSDFEVTAITLAGINDNSSSPYQTIDFVRGGSLFVNAADDFTLQATRQTRVALNVLHGCFKSPNRVMTLGTAKYNNKIATRHYYKVGGSDVEGEQGVMEFKGIKSATTYTSYLDIETNGLVKLGSGGLDFTGSDVVMKLNMLGGTLQFTENAACKVGHADGMNVQAPSTLAVTKGTTLTMVAAITGTGVLRIEAVGEGEDDAILDLGTIRTTTPLKFGDGVKLALELTDLNEQIALNAKGLEASDLVLTDPTGESIDTDKLQFVPDGNGGVTIAASVPTLTLTGDVDFTTGNWSSGSVPTSGGFVISATGDVKVTLPATVSGNSYTTVKITGGGKVTFVGDGTLNVESLEIEENSTLVQSGKFTMAPVTVGEGSTYILDATDVTDGMTITEKISGAGAVRTKGTVVMDNVHTFTGGITVEKDSLLSAADKYLGGDHNFFYGAQGGAVTVEDGGCVDMTGTKDTHYLYTIAGEGVNGSGAMMKERVENLTDGAAQTVGIALMANAVISTSYEWGLVSNKHTRTTLDLSNHTLTKKGTNTFWIVNTTALSAGTIVLQEGTMVVNNNKSYPSHLDNVAIELEGSAVLNMKISPGDLSKIKITDAATGAQIKGMQYLNKDIPLELAGGTLAYDTDDTLSLANVRVTENSTIQMADGKTLTVAEDVAITTAENKKLTFAAVTDGSATVDFGTARPTASLVFDAGVNVVVQLAEGEKLFRLTATGLTKENLTIKDAVGAEISKDNIAISDSGEDGRVTISTSVPVLTLTEDASFTDVVNWDVEAHPTFGNFIVQTAVGKLVTVDLTGVSSACKYNGVTVKGGGTIRFVNGTLVAKDFVIDENSTLVQSGCLGAIDEETPMTVTVHEGSFYILDATELASGLTSTATISGAGAVVTRGNVVMAAANTFTGGLTAESGILSLTNNHGFGGSGEDARDAFITVKYGACVDVKGTGGYRYGFKIAGNGVLLENGEYTGALMHSASGTIGSDIKQIWYLELLDDAMVMTQGSHRWGLRGYSSVHSELWLNNHTLTVAGTGDRFWIAYTDAKSAGTLRFTDKAVMSVCKANADLTGVDLVIEDQARLNAENTISNLKSLTFLPGTNGCVSVNYAGTETRLDNLTGLATLTVPFVEPETLEVGAQYQLFQMRSADSTAVDFDSNAFFKSVNVGGRFTTNIVGKTLYATVSELQNFWHYDFDRGFNMTDDKTAEDAALAEDSRYKMTSVDGASSPTTKWVSSPCRGKAVGVCYGGSTFYPRWNGTSAAYSPFATRAFTSTVVIRPNKDDENPRIVWSFSSTDKVFALAMNKSADNAFDLVAWKKGDEQVQILATVKDIPNFASAYHFVAVMVTPEKTMLQVDDTCVEADALSLTGMPNSGQLGGFYGIKVANLDFNFPAAPGDLVADWQIYDAALSEKELADLRRNYNPSALQIIIR